MPNRGSNSTEPDTLSPPLWLLAELTYGCPLQCPYCSNPIEFARYRRELNTQEWLRVLREGREMGAVQLGLSGGEPLVRRDLEKIVAEASKLDYYSNLITSGLGLSANRIAGLHHAGLDHIQLSFQAATQELNDYMAGTRCFDQKLRAAKAIKAAGFPMVLCFVLYRENIHQVRDMLVLAEELGADYVELANTQYHGWALLNRNRLMPTREQVEEGERVVNEFREAQQRPMKIYYVVPDYFDGRPKACVNGWGTTFLTVTADGAALPCHSARDLPGMEFPNVRDESLYEIWHNSALFNRFRGYEWMKEPCRSCPEREQDFGGCRCQAYLLTGDPANADPTCSHSAHHQVVRDVVEERGLNATKAIAQEGKREAADPVVWRNTRSSAAHGQRFRDLAYEHVGPRRGT